MIRQPELLDWAVFMDSVAMFGHRAVRRESCAAFRLIQKDLNSMRTANCAPSFTVWATKLHRGIGPCGVFGAKALMTNLQHLEFMLRAGQTDGLARKAETVSNLAQLTTLEVKWRIGFFGVRADSVPRSLKQAA